MKLQPAKCNFLRKETIYLGHLITAEVEIKLLRIWYVTDINESEETDPEILTRAAAKRLTPGKIPTTEETSRLENKSSMIIETSERNLYRSHTYKSVQIKTQNFRPK